MRRVLWVILVLGLGVRTATAQVVVTPYASGTLGIGTIRTTSQMATSPPTVSQFVEHSWDMLLAADVGVAFGRHLAVDANVRSSFGVGTPFRALSIGPAVQWGSTAKWNARVGLGRVEGFESVSCPAAAAGCPSHVGEWANGFDLSAGVTFPQGARWSVGPMLWWVQSTGGVRAYRSIGLGVSLRHG